MATINMLPFEIWNSGAMSDAEIAFQLESLIAPHISAQSYPQFDANVKKQFSQWSIQKYPSAEPVLQLAILKTFKALFRDRDHLDALVTPNFAQFIVAAAALIESGQYVENFEVTMEACRCLVNGLYQSQLVRSGFIIENCMYVTHLADRIFTTSLQIFNPTVQQPIFPEYALDKLLEFLYLDLRITFVITALDKQAKLALAEHTRIFVGVVRAFVDRMLKAIENPANEAPPKSLECTTEALRILFNVYCHSTDPEYAAATACAAQCSLIIRSNGLPVGLKQDAVNALTTITSFVHELCPAKTTVDDASSTSIIYENHDVTFVEALIKLLEQVIDQTAESSIELLATFFIILLQICKDVKAVRRYCRMRILPPLRAVDVEKPPEQGTALRNRLIRLMSQSVGEVKKLIAEFLFVLCKRSVPRMVKYCGFGHSAGLLADYGFLGRLSEQRRASDSEDSETEDYKRVEQDVNAVTGFIQPPATNPFEGMSEEQKEYEAMRLANTMDKLLDAGVFVPGQLGPDGRPQPISHVNELVKNIQLPKSNDSDAD